MRYFPRLGQFPTQCQVKKRPRFLMRAALGGEGGP